MDIRGNRSRGAYGLRHMNLCQFSVPTSCGGGSVVSVGVASSSLALRKLKTPGRRGLVVGKVAVRSSVGQGGVRTGESTSPCEWASRSDYDRVCVRGRHVQRVGDVRCLEVGHCTLPQPPESSFPRRGWPQCGMRNSNERRKSAAAVRAKGTESCCALPRNTSNS